MGDTMNMTQFKREPVLEPDQETKKDLIRSENEGYSNMYESQKEKESKAIQKEVDEKKGEPMSIVKVIEVISQSPESWEDAAQKTLAEVTRTLRNVQSIYIKDFQISVDNNKITNYRVTAKVSFVVNNDDR